MIQTLMIKKKERCDMIANKRTLHKRPNDTEINNNLRSPLVIT